MPPKRKRIDNETNIQNDILHKNLINFLSNDKFNEMKFDEKVDELIKFDLNKIIEYIDSCNKTNKKLFKEIFYLIGGIFYFGIKLEKNLEKGHIYTLISANFGFLNACFAIGSNFAYGIGCEKNLNESFKYYKISADKNHHQGQYRIGEMYEKGIGCEKNQNESFRYYKLCADNTTDIYYGSLEDNIKFTTFAKYNIGTYYLQGIGVEKNLIEGIRYIKMASDKKFPQAIYSMFTFYYKGEGVEKNIDEAIKYLKLGAEIRDASSIYQLILLNYNCKIFDIPQNIEEGFKYIKLFLEIVNIDNIYSKVNKKLTIKGTYLYKIIYEILLQNDMELNFVQELISKYPVFSNLNSLLQFKLNKKKLQNYTKIDRCMVCFEDNVTTQLFDCLGHYYCQNCTIKIKDCCLCKSHKRCFH
jgi:TPR repeat protein